MATSAPATRRRARRSALCRAANMVSMSSPVAFPVGKGSASATTSFRRSSVAAKIPMTPIAIPHSARPQPGKLRPNSAIAGTGPPTPATKPMMAAEAAVVCVMLFSSAL